MEHHSYSAAAAIFLVAADSSIKKGVRSAHRLWLLPAAAAALLVARRRQHGAAGWTCGGAVGDTDARAVHYNPALNLQFCIFINTQPSFSCSISSNRIFCYQIVIWIRFSYDSKHIFSPIIKVYPLDVKVKQKYKRFVCRITSKVIIFLGKIN